MVDYYIKYF